jgi:hypothetical protein
MRVETEWLECDKMFGRMFGALLVVTSRRQPSLPHEDGPYYDGRRPRTTEG